MCVYIYINQITLYLPKANSVVNQLNFNLKKKKQNIHFGVKWMGILTPAPSLII